jgi:hypothetical protein
MAQICGLHSARDDCTPRSGELGYFCDRDQFRPCLGGRLVIAISPHLSPLKEHPMTRLLATTLVFIAMLAITGRARGQDDRGDLPEGIRKLIRAADEAEQRVRRENGVAADPDAERQSKSARIAARRAIREFWFAKYDYDRAAGDLATANAKAAEAHQHFLQLKAAAIPDPPRLQRAETDRDDALSQVADAAMKLEQARQALENASRSQTAGGPATTTSARPTVPGEPQPYGSAGSVMIGSSATAPISRFVYRNETSSYHLLGLVGSASYWQGALPRLDPLDFVKETAHFYFYRPHAPDSQVQEFAFAKLAEIPSSDGIPKFAAWRRDASGWHWEWTHRDSAATEIMSPAPLIPGPVSVTQSTGAQTSVLVTEGR